jgi:uncharacterized protein YndB with AHSA1/START domain
VLHFERRLAHPPAKVFAAISDPEELAHWFPARVRWDLRPGTPIEFRFEDVDFEAPAGEVLEVDPPKLLVYAWGDGVLRWEIVPDAAGSILRFSHTIAGEDDWPARLAAARHASGWDVCLAALEARLGGTAGGELDWFARNETYVERFGLAEGEVRALDDGHEVRFERDLVKPAAEFWAGLGGGDAPGTVPPLFTDGHTAAGALMAAEPARMLEYEWLHDGEPAGRVRWELREHVFGSGLILTQTVPDRLARLLPAALARWQCHLELLIARMHGMERRQPEVSVETLAARYRRRLEAPGPQAARR